MEVRERLHRAAVELIAERGWTAVSTRVLAERAGVTPSVVHYHFPSMAALRNEAATGLLRRVLDEAQPVLDAAATPEQVVTALLASVDEFTGADPASLVAVEAYLAATRDETLREQIRDLLTEFRRRVADRLARQGVAEPEPVAVVLAAALDGLLLHRGLGAGTDLGQLTGVLLRLVGREAE